MTKLSTVKTSTKENAAPLGILALANAPNNGKSIQPEASQKQWNRKEANDRIRELEREKEDLRREKDGFEKLFSREQKLRLREQELFLRAQELHLGRQGTFSKALEIIGTMTDAIGRLQSENADLERQLSAMSVAEEE